MTTLTRRPVNVTVAILNDNPPQFEMTSNIVPIKKKGGSDDDILSFDNNQGGKYEDGFEISFNVEDDTNNGYVFFQDPRNPDPNDAMAVKIVNQNGHCPRSGQTWAGFAPKEVTNDQMTLVVENPNTHLQYFGFAMFFSRPGERKPSLTFDPIGDNKNGEPPRGHKPKGHK